MNTRLNDEIQLQFRVVSNSKDLESNARCSTIKPDQYCAATTLKERLGQFEGNISV